MFLIFVNNIKEAIKTGKPYSFADDNALLYIYNNQHSIHEAINEDMKSLNKWMNMQKLQLNTKKTKYMIISPKTNIDIGIKYNNVDIEMVEVFDYLGLRVDRKYTWNPHAKRLNRKLSQIAGIFRRIRSVLPRQLLNQIYYALFQSHILYGISIWGTITKTTMANLQVSQNKAIRNLFNEDRRTRIKTLHTNHSLLPITHHIALSTIVHNIVNNYTHSNTTFTFNSDIDTTLDPQ